jgi:hypothetical protein
LRVERHDGQGGPGVTLPARGEPGDGGAGNRRLHDVVPAAHLDRAVPFAHSHLHGRDHHALGAEPRDVAFQLATGVVPRLADELGPAGHLGVARPEPGLAGGIPVVVARPDRDAEHEPGGDPALRDQFGEILPGQIAGEGHRWPVRARRADRGADGLEPRPAEGERPPGQPDTHHSVPAKLGALGGHPVDGRVPGLVHGLHERAERTRAVLP